ncbi:MAG: hypothetical protein ACFCVE_16115 [Phycisphaerae bacterium]
MRAVASLMLSCFAASAALLPATARAEPLQPDAAQPGPTQAAWTEDFVESLAFVVKLHYRGEEFVNVVEPILLESGVRYVRDGGIRPHVTENAARLYRDHGIRFTVVADPRDKVMPDNVVEQLILPYGGAILAVEGPNEWDNRKDKPLFDGLVWPEHMQTYQSQLYEAIKGHEDPMVRRVQVLSPSLAHPHANAKDLGDMSDVIDFVNLHPYQGGRVPLDQWESKWLRGARFTSSSRPIVITETGYHYRPDKITGQPAISEAAGARYVPRLFLDMYRMGIHRTHYYNLSANPWGEIREDGTPRPSVIAVGNLVRLLEDPPTDGRRPYEVHENDPFRPDKLEYTLTGGDDSLRRLLFQKRDGRFYLVLWQDAVSYDVQTGKDVTVEPQQVQLTLPAAADVASYLPSESREAQQHAAGVRKLTVAVPDHPLVLEVTPAE